jgi:hypothetical protein
MEDWIASWILSQPLYTILVNERQMTKTGDVIMHLEYEDHMGLGYDYFAYLVKAKSNEEEKTEIIEEMEAQFVPPETDEDEIYDLLLPPPKKTKDKKTAKKQSASKTKSNGKKGGKVDEREDN